MGERKKIMITEEATLEFVEEVADDIDKLAKKYGGQTEVLKKAMGLFNYIDQHLEEGWVVVLESEKENLRKEIITL